MILLDTDKHVFIAHDYPDMVAQLLEQLEIRDDSDLASLAAACLDVNDLDVMITHVTP